MLIVSIQQYILNFIYIGAYMNFLYVFSCVSKSEQFLVTAITSLSVLCLQRVALSGYMATTLLFVPDPSVEYLERIKQSLHIEGYIVPKDKQITLEGAVTHDRAVIPHVEVNWDRLVREHCPECTLENIHLQNFPIPFLFVRNTITGRATTLPADVWFTR